MFHVVQVAFCPGLIVKRSRYLKMCCLFSKIMNSNNLGMNLFDVFIAAN